jgi:MoaA/NifB/PqqE/SkfB family radical SAM enzyme
LQISGSLRRLFNRNPKSISNVQFLNKPIENAELARAEYREGETTLRSLPPMVNFSLTTYCNFQMPCLPCDRHTRHPLADSNTDNDVIDAVYPLLKTALCVVIYSGGESLLSKYFDRVIGLIDPPTRVQFATNGSLLTKRKANLMLEKDIMDLLSISLDAATPETYRIMRPSSNFENVVRNVTYYANRIRALNRDKAYVSLNMTVCRTNLEDVPKLVDLAEQVGASHIEYRHLNKGSGHVVKTVDGWDWVYSDQEKFDDAARHDELILEAYHRGKSRGIKIWFLGTPFIGPFAQQAEEDVLRDLAKYNPSFQPDEESWYSPKRKLRGMNRHTCHGPWRKIAIQPKGDVRLCCYHDITKHKLGNVLESDILSIWNSGEMIAQRQQTLDNMFSNACLSSLPCGPRGRL